ncbi:hypothetical protein IAU60_003765 [Kwoniella sp. DSM 27419]
MGIFDFLPCCGPRKEKIKDVEQSPETTSLLPPPREESILSADGLGGGYGATNEQGLTDEQRLRIEAIGREVGNHMLPIHSLPPGQRTSPSLSRDRSARAPSPGSHSAASSPSRPSSPSPMRPETSPPGGMMQSTERGEVEDDVVRKTLFAGGGGMRKGPAGRGKGKRGKGRK